MGKGVIVSASQTLAASQGRETPQTREELFLTVPIGLLPDLVLGDVGTAPALACPSPIKRLLSRGI